ncbi:PTS sugar transporter subunit IIA [Virgibacillus pantothenticus]|uniref:PTS sugar transporter subunit IIA n=1 Tax=Virgibacillus pantothenticus TaxID=1473 RepID=A0A0L0QMU7_VIRPA|nr:MULTISPECIES: PTS sugar transporter subunit IIA [Virgibacillus]API93278.1 PTS sugar transporter subunit IIA [Virgibacillus sp. 6R]KNE19553.1 PTS sugar transporter subunit IIA [Virgibacillus pantothenticus]MBS7428676.1 PTS sugar transporter subunit IIA [Virgibacillus sp. 19R1-5]MED3737305.1 PTS sugar transporter subunit IIA [Virgibacillus pantothenticus]QTY14916.1 PTS sugar transporter subunit IIA [Virgibacillus pantothenticus]
MKFLEETIIQLNVEVNDAEEAIDAAGQLLLKDQLIQPSYIEAMKQAYKKNGPYFVLAPQIAIPHARPEDGVNEAAVSLVQLKEPISFGHAINDPVRLVFGLGAASSAEHLSLLRKLTSLLNDPQNIEQLLQATTIDEIQKTIGMER